MSQAGILQALAAGPLTERELAGALGVGQESVRVACVKLEERGQIHVEGFTKGRGPRRRVWALGAGSRPSKTEVIAVRGRRHVDEELGCGKTTAREDALIARAKVRGLTWWGAL